MISEKRQPDNSVIWMNELSVGFFGTTYQVCGGKSWMISVNWETARQISQLNKWINRWIFWNYQARGKSWMISVN